MNTFIFIASHGGTSGQFPYYGNSKFEDFKLILSIVQNFMAVKLHFFGLSLSISEVIICTIILSVVFIFFLKILGGD